MSYEINFDSRTSADEVAQAVPARYGIPPELIYVGDPEALGEHPGPDPEVLITPAPDGDTGFACRLEASDILGEAAGGIDELGVAVQLCQDLNTRAIVDDGGKAATVWFLVTADGWRGRVVVDEERLDDEFVILHAYQAVPSDPEIPVVAPPEWETGWYPDGEIPT